MANGLKFGCRWKRQGRVDPERFRAYCRFLHGNEAG